MVLMLIQLPGCVSVGTVGWAEINLLGVAEVNLLFNFQGIS